MTTRVQKAGERLDEDGACLAASGSVALEERLAAAASVTAVGSLATGLVHEINNPLAVVLMNLEEAVRACADLAGADRARETLVDLREMLGEAHAASQRIEAILRDLRAFSCAEGQRARIPLNGAVEAACNLAFAEIRHRARLKKELTADLEVLGCEGALAQVVLQLLVNAAHAMPEGEVDRNEILVTTRRQGQSAIVIEVADSGAGIAPSDLRRVCEPFFTTKPRSQGMGLTIARATARAHGGEVSLRRRDGGGTVARVVLPTLEAASAEAPAGPGDGSAGQQPRVLVVDDDPLVLRALTRVLARDFQVASARSGREAIDLVRAGGVFDAMLCDLVMPELSGIELYELLAKHDPELAKRTIFLTGGAFSGRAQAFLEEVGQPHLEKPVDVKVVRALLMELSHPTGGDGHPAEEPAAADPSVPPP